MIDASKFVVVVAQKVLSSSYTIIVSKQHFGAHTIPTIQSLGENSPGLGRSRSSSFILEPSSSFVRLESHRNGCSGSELPPLPVIK